MMGAASFSFHSPPPAPPTGGRGRRRPPFPTAPPQRHSSRQRFLPSLPSEVAIRCSDGWRENFQRVILHAMAGALSLGILVVQHPPPSFASVETVTDGVELCREEDGGLREEVGVLTNEGLVEEAWRVVNESFLDAGNHGWSPEKWQQKKKDIFSSRIQSRSRAHEIIQRMLSSLHDPYTRFLSPSEFSKMARYDITGIGINLREVPDDSGDIKLKVLGIILDGPAHSAGVRQGDELLSVNGVDVKGKSAFEVSSLLQGPTETFVDIEVKHGDCSSVQPLKVQRKLVARTPVLYRLEKVDDGKTSVGYVRLKEFNALARKDLVIALKRLQDSGASYFVLDLRDNLGGLVQAGIEVAKLFLDQGDMVIYTEGRDPDVQRSIVAESTPKFTNPLIVLVNNRTASASEIVAAAVQDNCRAILVGDRTYGKGLIQSVFELQDGSGVVVTIGKYVTPNHLDLNENGIKPDFSQIPDFADLNEVESHLLQCKMQRKV